MPRLVIRSGPLANQEFALAPGTHHVGRAFANDICLEEPSVSSSHCQIVVGEDGATIIDLNSTNGTFLNGAPVQSARLKAGDAVRLGGVECVLVADAPVARPVVRVAMPKTTTAPPPAGESPPPAVRVAAPGALPPEPPRIAPELPPLVTPVGVPEAAWCRNHPKNAALYWCVKCQKGFCELCVAVRHVGHVPTHNCRLCGGECTALSKRPQAPGKREIRFYAELGRAFAYPFHAEGLVILGAGTVFYLFLQFVSYVASMGGLFGLAGVIIITIFSLGYLFAYMKRIIVATAEGADDMPDWPEFTEWWDDILLPFFQMIGTMVFSFLPVVFVGVAAVKGVESAGWLLIPAIIAGCLYYPMGLLSVAMHDTIAGLNPMLVVLSICRVFREYIVTCVVLGGIFLVRAATGELLPIILPVPIVPQAIAGFVGLYLLVVLMRVIGLLYLAKKDALGWFNR